MTVAAPLDRLADGAARHVPRSQREWWRLLTNVPFVFGSLGIAAIAAMALFGPQLAPSDPQAQRVVLFYPDASFATPPTPPDEYNLLGTDPLGRDQLSRLLWGARLTLTVVLLGLLGRGLLAVALGVLAGWRRGTWLDQVIGHVTNAIGGLPQLMLALLLVIALQGQGITGFVLALALVGWAELAQFVRGEVVRVVATPHVEAARTLGATGAHVVRVHVLRDLAPQLLGLLALEAGSVLLLLAELGFIGFFVAGGVFYVDDSNRPILPVRDRAPEWGQMLAGARNYAFRDQYVAFVPGIVVVSAVLAFNLFAEGLRGASDPFSPKRLSPRTLGGLARGVVGAGLLASVGFGYVAVTSTEIGYDDGLRRARDAAERVLPASDLVAGIVRLSSASHALARPEKLTYYFRDPGSTILRVSFVDADANAMEVKLHANEDELLIDSLRPLGDRRFTGWEPALRTAEELRGIRYRNENPAYLVRVVLAQDIDAARPVYRVHYGKVIGGTQIEVRVDAVTGSTSLPPQAVIPDAASRARVALGGEPRLIRMSASWLSPGPNRTRAYGADRPAQYHFDFVRGDINFPTTVRVTMEAGNEMLASTAQTGSFGGSVDTRTMPIPPFSLTDLQEAFAKAEEAGLRARREALIAQGSRTWDQTAFASFSEGRWVIGVSLFLVTTGGEARNVTYRYDPQTGEIGEVPPGVLR